MQGAYAAATAPPLLLLLSSSPPPPPPLLRLLLCVPVVGMCLLRPLTPVGAPNWSLLVVTMATKQVSSIAVVDYPLRSPTGSGSVTEYLLKIKLYFSCHLTSQFHPIISCLTH